MTIEELLEKYKRKYPGVPYEISRYYKTIIISEKNGRLHSYNDAPAVVDLNEIKTWIKNGKRHRENDKPAVVYPDGRKFYFYNGVSYEPKDKPEFIKRQINKLTVGKSSKQKTKEDLLKEFVNEMLST